mmetsp:Transcript_6213/g.20590  ORF Transcript_6213/g.20590 Transcript_6213/m.20590 type:complete len:243 (-) Transcript_6213:342-1070(-)
MREFILCGVCSRGEAEDAEGALVAAHLVLVVARKGEQHPLRVEGDRVGRSLDGHRERLLAGRDVRHVDERVLGPRGDVAGVVREGEGADGPLEPRKGGDARELLDVPERDERVRAAHREPLPRRRELEAVAVCSVAGEGGGGRGRGGAVARLWRRRRRLEEVNKGEDVDIASPGGEEEEAPARVPRHLVHLVRKLHRAQRLALARLDDRDVVLLVAHREVLPVRRPPDVDVLAPRLDCVHAL